MNRQLAEILVRNLVKNAVFHNYKKGEVFIDLHSGGFTIENTSDEPALQPDQLFKRFNKNNNKTESTGLGLAIVKAIANVSGLAVNYSFTTPGKHLIKVSSLYIPDSLQVCSQIFPDSFHFFVLNRNNKMQRLTGLLIFLLFSGNMFAQKIDQKNVPAVIINSFQVKFPTAEDVDWRLDKGNYRVNFEVNDKDHEVRLDSRGRFVKHEQDLYVSEIPKVVLETIREKVPFFDVDDANKITENGKTTFEINFDIDNKDHDFWISEKGKILKYRKELKDSEIPTEIQTLIKNKYGILDVDRAEYNEENGTIIYYLKGEINDKDHEFTFQDKIKLLLHKQDLRDSEIPSSILNALKTSYKDFEIRDADLREEDSAVFYIIQLRKSRERITLTFNRKGELIASAK